MDEVSERYRPADVEAEVAEYWEAVDAYDVTKAARSDGPTFYFLDGPPYTNGEPHMGHAWNKTLKDCYIRYKRMCGYDVIDRPGWDTHGLPIETGVEEDLGFETKKDIEAYGPDAFIEECKDFAMHYLDVLQQGFEDFGVWMDWDDAYLTLTPEYMEAAWWAFKEIHEHGLVEQGKRSISQCPRCETAIANNEVEYEQVEDPSIYVRFPLADRAGDLVIWTTTPWTIPANTFVAVHPDLEYQLIAAARDGETDLLWIAERCVEEVLKKGRYDDYEVRETVPGSEMVGWRYEPPLADEVPNHPGGEDSFRVYEADYVEADRTGLVHSAPGHGEEDFVRGQELDLPLFCPVAEDGVFTDEGGAYAGSFVRDANPDIRADLDENGLLLADEVYTHDYGHCWRCDTGIVQIVTDQWFVTVTDVKDDLLANIEDSEWYPGWARDNRFRDFVEESPDWTASRQRYWGTPLPIWVPEHAPSHRLDEDMIVIGSREELAQRVDQDVDPATVDLHRSTVDDLTITEDGTTYRRVPDVFDVWFDSGVAPWGSVAYPAVREDIDDLLPADLIIEAHDQTRGWFWSMLAVGTAVGDGIPYRDVLMYGHALMPDGRAMSKSKGLSIDPYEAIESHGVDVMRLALLSHNPQGEDMRFSWDTMDDVERQLNILWNVCRFPLPYMELDDVDPADLDIDAVADDLEIVDEWVLARLQSVIDGMSADYASFRQDRAIDRLISFVVEDVSRYYVQAVRERMWLEEEAPEKLAAYATLTTVLDAVIRLLAPVAPHLAEKMHYVLFDAGTVPTVHARSWPAVDDRFSNPDLEDQIERLRAIEEAAATARQQAGRKRRWPIRRLVIETDDDAVAAAAVAREDLLEERVNAKEVLVVAPPWEELEPIAKPRMDRIGPAYGELAAEIMTLVEDAPIEEIADGLEIDGEPIQLEGEMYETEFEPPEGVTAAPFEDGTVYVDVSLTPAIEAEGYAREVVRRIQEMRKELDLEIDTTIETSLSVADDAVAGYVDEWRDYIANETRTAAFVEHTDGVEKRWDIEDTTVTIGIEVAQPAD